MLRQKSENSIDHKSTPFSNVREDYREFSEEMIELRHYEVINPEASWEERELGIVYIWEIE